MTKATPISMPTKAGAEMKQGVPRLASVGGKRTSSAVLAQQDAAIARRAQTQPPVDVPPEVPRRLRDALIDQLFARAPTVEEIVGP